MAGRGARARGEGRGLLGETEDGVEKVEAEAEEEARIERGRADRKAVGMGMVR